MDLSQATMRAMFIPVIRERGALYEKYGHVEARQSPGGEHIVSVTSDGTETENTSTPGDFIVRNQTAAGEKYIVPRDKFLERYTWVADRDDGLAEYAPKGTVNAIRLTSDLLAELDLDREFHFEAPWGSAQIARLGDYIVAPPDFSEVYRIANTEFGETYRLAEEEE